MEVDRLIGSNGELLVVGHLRAPIPAVKVPFMVSGGSRRWMGLLKAPTTTLSVSLPATPRTSITNRELRSSRVATWVLRAPMMRSPSQCPGTARSSALGGRSRIDTASLILPRC